MLVEICNNDSVSLKIIAICGCVGSRNEIDGEFG